MNNISVYANNSGLAFKNLKSGAQRVSVPTHASLRKLHERMDGESRSAWDKRIESIRAEYQAGLDVCAGAVVDASIREGFAYKTITHKLNGEVHVVLAPPAVDNTLKKKLAAIAKLQAEVAEIQEKSKSIEVAA